MIDKEFNQLIKKLLVDLSTIDEYPAMFKLISKTIKVFLPSDSVHILSIDESNHTISSREDNSLSFSLDTKGIITECYKSHQPLIVNDINRSLLYNAKIDTLGNDSIYKVLVFPIIDNSSSKKLLGILWLGIKKGFKQFIQKDIDRLLVFSNAIKYKLFSLSSPSKDSCHLDGLLICQEAQNKLKIKLARAEKYFATTVHDIRTPMNAIIGFMELMLLNEKDEQKKDYIDATLKSGEHIIALINDALDMSKVQNGKMTLEKTSFSPMEGIADIAKLFYNSMSAKSITFSIYIDPLMPTFIVSDLHRIKQIINNLLSNAIKFTSQEGTVSLEAHYDKTKDTLAISISDTGIGIAKEKQKSIFNPYTQEKDSTASQYGGTGLGLAISQQLSILLNGTLKLESEQGKGSNFIFTFPCYTPKDSKEAIENTPFKNTSILLYYSLSEYSALKNIDRYLNDLNIKHRHIGHGQAFTLDIKTHTLFIIEKKNAIHYVNEIQDFMNNGGKVIFIKNNFDSEKCMFIGEYQMMYRPLIPNVFFDSLHQLIDPNIQSKLKNITKSDYKTFKGHSILVVDDSRINLKLLSEVLKKFEIDVSTAVNGKEALEIFKTKTFSAIFVDQNMPMMNGDEVIKKMRTLEKEMLQKATVIYALTGDAQEEVSEQLINAGANSILHKPIHINEINEAISKAIKS